MIANKFTLPPVYSTLLRPSRIVFIRATEAHSDLISQH